MYFLRFQHGFHSLAKLYPQAYILACFMRFRGSSDRAAHHATTAPRHAHPRAELAEYARTPPLIILIRWHGAMHALPTGRLQARIAHAIISCVAASRRSSPCHVWSGSRAAGVGVGIVEGMGTRVGHSPRKLIMNTNDSLTWVPRSSSGGRRAAP